MIINKKIKRTMFQSKSQYFGSFVLIVISCLLFTMFNMLSDNMSNITSSFEDTYVQEDANFITDSILTNIPELEEKFDILLEGSSTIDYTLSDNKILRIFSENTKVNLPAIIKGKELNGNDIFIDPAFAKANKLAIGDNLKIYDRNLTISGFMSLPNYIYPLKSDGDLLRDANSFGIAVIGGDDFQSFNKGNSFYSLKYKGEKSNFETVMTQFKEYLRNENISILNWVNADANLRITFVQTKLGGINQVSSTMPTAILLLSCILSGMVMWRLLKRESAIIGTLYALGYKKKEIQNHYLRYPLSVAVIGGIIGTILGSVTLKPMLNVMVTYFNMPVGIVNYSIKYIIISILLPIVFLGVAGYIVTYKSLKSSPLELMRGGDSNYKVGFLEKNLKLDRFKFTTKFKIREQLRSIPRSVFLLLGVAIATMLLLIGFAAKSSLDYVMVEGFKQAFKYNYHYVFNTLQTETRMEGEAFSEELFSPESNDKLNLAVYGVTPNSKYITFKDKSGNQLNTNQVIMTKPLADKLKVKPSDTVKIISKTDSKEYSVTIDSIAETYVGNYIYMPLSQFNSMLNYPSGSYFGLWSKDKLNIPEDQLLAALSVDDMKNAFNSMTQPIQATVGTMAFISFIIGLIVIYVVTSMIIEENKENISLMKVLGYRKREVYSMILNSSSFLIILGFILGIPLLFMSLGSMLNSLTKDMSVALPLKIDSIYLILGFVIIYLTFEVSKALSKKKVSKISMNEVLKSRLE
ncbi:FtsX-like permease family protein [Anaerocolumna sedimenticola]|uniref:FtsX-like permease family protein n=1 Tax=Anaerocolumna sedimenticola TaxID=2696063 RepID=A0A6P1TI89_9FIRM|nr:ABC transporter permease [Anaerocolumna sedimenticola]QHQ59761.1 FtsX-like permease family protein [Anaerocolumna sedimenticola]